MLQDKVELLHYNYELLLTETAPPSVFVLELKDTFLYIYQESYILRHYNLKVHFLNSFF